MGFLRFSEITNLKCSDIILKETHMPIFIEKKPKKQNKTEVYREGYWMHLSKLHSALCSIKYCLGSTLKPQELKNQKRNLFLGRFVIAKTWINPFLHDGK